MKKLVYIFLLIIVGAGAALTFFSPDTLSRVIVFCITLLGIVGIVSCLFPMLLFITAFDQARKKMRRAEDTSSEVAWVSVLGTEKYFEQKKLDKIFGDYREKIKAQRDAGQVMTDIEEYINEDVLALLSWQGVAAQIPGTMTSLGLLGTFVGLLYSLQQIGLSNIDEILESIETILLGINVAFYTSISGIILSIIFNISYNIIKNTLSREAGMFMEDFHKYIVPATDEQTRYMEWTEVRNIVKLLERLPRNGGYSLAGGGEGNGKGGHNRNEQILMPQILDGLKNREFIFFLQPRYELSTKKIVGAEALVRWNHGSLGLISPAVFIPLLESNGYITKLDQYIWEEVCKTIRKWLEEGYRPIPLSVNVTKTDILALDVGSFFEEMLDKYDIPPKYLDIEISENAYLQSQGLVNELEEHLMKAGFKVVMDGFNGDYVAFNFVDRTGINAGVLKLDLRYFEEENNLNGLMELFERARKQNITIMAEGIENMEQLNALRKAGCTEGQGFYFSKPLSLEEFDKVVKGESL